MSSLTGALSWADLPALAGQLALIAGILSLALTLNAARPLFMSGSAFGVFSFFSGWLIAELAAHHLIAQGLVFAFFIAIGALGSWQGMAGISLGVLSGALLLRLHRRAYLTDGSVRNALEEALGEELFDNLRASAALDGTLALDDARLPLRQLLFPFSYHDKRVERIHGEVIHRFEDGPTLRADIYKPAGELKDAPILVYLHGGAWVLGFKRYQGLPLMSRLAAHGWICISVDYRRSPRFQFPAHLEDAKRGIAWARENAERLGGDSSFIVVSGNSAGAHLASLAALTPNRPELQPGFEEADTRVAACVSFYGVYDFKNRGAHFKGLGLRFLIERVVMGAKLETGEGADADEEAEALYTLASPLDHLHEDAPPFFIVHGEFDSLVPVGEARDFAENLRQISKAPVIYAEIPGAQHAFEVFRSVRAHLTLRAIVFFLNHLAKRP